MRIEPGIDDGNIFGMVTLFDEKEWIMFSDISDMRDGCACQQRTGEHGVEQRKVHKHTTDKHVSHGNIHLLEDRPHPMRRGTHRTGKLHKAIRTSRGRSVAEWGLAETNTLGYYATAYDVTDHTR